MIKPKEEIKKVLNTQERISIAQCLNLANEYLIAKNAVTISEELYSEKLKATTKMFHKIKISLEQEYVDNDGKFRS
jgi:hypothetical protein